MANHRCAHWRVTPGPGPLTTVGLTDPINTVQTLDQYAYQVAAGDRGRWRSATRCAADLLASHDLTIDLGRRLPLPQILLQSTALIVYGLAARDATDPTDASPLAVHRWIVEHLPPCPPHPDSTLTVEQWQAVDRRWRRDLQCTTDRLRHDLADLLRRAGHEVPDADIRSLLRYSADPVVMTWIDLADIDAPDTPARYSVGEQFPLPRLALGVSAYNDLFEQTWDSDTQDDEW